jgi:hypothetical protein
MNTPCSENELDIQCGLQSVRHKLIAKSITLQKIKQQQTTINFVNQLDLPAGLRELIINHGFTLDLLLNEQPTHLAENLGIDEDIAKIITDATKMHMKAAVSNVTTTTDA